MDERQRELAARHFLELGKIADQMYAADDATLMRWLGMCERMKMALRDDATIPHMQGILAGIDLPEVPPLVRMLADMERLRGGSAESSDYFIGMLRYTRGRKAAEQPQQARGCLLATVFLTLAMIVLVGAGLG